MKSKNYPVTEEKDLKQTISKLKATIRRQANEKKKLKQELHTLKDALHSSMGYINEQLEGIPVEDIVRYFNNKKKGKLDEVAAKKQFETMKKPKSGKPVVTDETRQETIDKWKKWNESRNSTE